MISPLKQASHTLALVVFASATLVGCNGGNGADPKDPSDQVGDSGGKPAPEIQAEPVGGDGPKTLAEAKGTVTIVDFWATFCDPCRKSFPKYQELVDTHAGDLVVIAVSVDDPEDVSAEDIQGWVDELGVTFPIVWDKDKKTAGAYEPPKMPTSYVIDKKGMIRHVHAGYTPDEADKIASEIEELIK